MTPEGFIAERLRFKGRMAVFAIAVSFFVMILAVAVSGGFRREIRSGIALITGDVLLTSTSFNYYSDTSPISSSPSYMPELEAVEGVETIIPVIYRAGIVKEGDDIQGVLFKGVPGRDSTLMADIPSRLASKLNLETGDEMLVYFVGDKIKARKFRVADIYESLVDADETLIAYVPIEDLRKVNGWEEGQISAMEVRLSSRFQSRDAIKSKSEQLGSICLMSAQEDEDSIVSVASTDKYSQIFDWLDLIDFNVYAILVLMTIVAGFNMISGLLILLFRSTSTIGTLKALGMNDKSISKVFLKVAARIVGIGMAIGNASALAFCAVQGLTHLVKLNPENYFVSFVPVKVSIPFILGADLVSFAVIMLLLLIPTLFIAKVDPAQTVKSE